jgi:hypothetical protein
MPARLRPLQARLLPHGFTDLARQVALFAIAYNAYRLVRGLVDDPAGATVAFQNARELISIERGLHIFVEPSIQAWADAQPIIVDAASWMYINTQTSVTLAALAFLYMFHNASFYFVRNMFMVAWVLALVGYIVFPTAPPRFFPEWGFFDAVSNFTGVTHDNVSVNALFNPYAAVPSMHVAFALMIGIPLARLVKHRTARVFWLLYPIIVTFVIVVTANHFIADAVLGALTAALAAYGAEGLARARPAAWAFQPSRASAAA